jgi:hypothetical protein
VLASNSNTDNDMNKINFENSGMQVLTEEDLAAVHGGSDAGDLQYVLAVGSAALGADAIVAAFIPVPGAQVVAAGLGIASIALGLASAAVGFVTQGT